MTLMFGLFTGILFGWLLQRARVLRYDKQLGALRLRDMTILKFMLSAILAASVGVHLLADVGLAELSIKGTALGAQILGGLLFGVGWALLGYCPGTSWGALGEGRFDALWGILGGWFGAALYAEAYPAMETSVLTWGNLGKLTLPGMLGVSHWLVIAALALGCFALFRLFERKGL
ncbi:YeeE/YedE family protein [Pseudodesulfovibrio sp. F-1]|uniref:YeeE/YedE family protein n=1 Tax=Pseudodesulfovibrio alkaliphilus TaxID=2661613 RepID=A0A7K1KN82_9BACT|nr:YeeE/YedE thiosulfate transporter family protein [Pseudodesulfovibrio alkaliphilus]MUM77342.1 YeeE/YedE family protein [Pseudodesulfovibrio alkaliphilus]